MLPCSQWEGWCNILIHYIRIVYSMGVEYINNICQNIGCMIPAYRKKENGKNSVKNVVEKRVTKFVIEKKRGKIHEN